MTADSSGHITRTPAAGARVAVAGPAGWTCSAELDPARPGEQGGVLACEKGGRRVETLTMCTTSGEKVSDCAWSTLRVGSSPGATSVVGLACSSPGRTCGGDAFVTDYAHYVQPEIRMPPHFQWRLERATTEQELPATGEPLAFTAAANWRCNLSVDAQPPDGVSNAIEVGHLVCRDGNDTAETAVVCAERSGAPFCNAGALRFGHDAVVVSCKSPSSTCW